MVDLSNEESWQLITQESKSVSGTPGIFNRLSEILIPIPFVSEYFKIFANTVNGKPTWNYAGRLYLFVGSINSFTPEYLESTGIILNEWRIVYFPRLVDTQNSHLMFEAPYWMPDISIELWQYQEI